MVMNFGYDVPKADVQWQPQGNNHKMSDVSAGFISAYLDDFPALVQSHARVYEAARALISQLGEERVRFFPNYSEGTPFASCIPLLFAAPVSEAMVVRLASEYAMDLRKYYKALDPLCRVSMDLYDRIVCFPCHRDMQQEHVFRINQVTRRIVELLEKP